MSEAKRGSNVQDLITAHDEARTKLLDRRDEMLFAKAGKFLIDAVEAEYEQTQLPRVFERARSHFSVFTHHNYELRLSKKAGAPRLCAIELGSREERGLDELSDGTRVQLLLAARIALAEENCKMAAAINLGLIRTKAASVSGPQALHVAPRPTVPVPDGLSAEEYGVASGVPRLAPALGYGQQHFFYVLSDDLNLLHDFLVNGIERVGQWKTVSGTTLADKLGAGSISSQEIAFRIDLLEHFCALWKQGKGRPVNREALEQSGALSDRYLDDVAAIADELDGDPERLLAALGAGEDPRLRGFRRNSFESLERYLRDNCYLDDRPVLSESDLRLRALASPAANGLSEGVASDCLNRWWTWAARLSEPEWQ